ncbi:rhodanese-like domain-containing protein [Flavobacterium filum]|uniref:rhodanese-like domain-containing protein n=1 Tax=Flavobacterium TaxID=237 RepID=UPI00040B5FA7|nr:rhodanese-like domain-containing protein [Flavobacterium filum]
MKKIVLVLLAFVSIACQSQQNPKVKVLPAKEYKTLISKEKVQLVDVRTPGEYSAGAIFGAVNIDVTNDAVFEKEIQKLDKSKPVYIYCRSGARSQKAAKKMSEMGFTSIIDLQGGYMAWN